jgi:hypothetical protein
MRKQTEIALSAVAVAGLTLFIAMALLFPPYPTSGGLTSPGSNDYEYDSYPGQFFVSLIERAIAAIR